MILLGLAASGVSCLRQGPATVIPTATTGVVDGATSVVSETGPGGERRLALPGRLDHPGLERRKKTWDRFYGPRKAANFGIGGDRTQHVLWRIQNGELKGIEPKVVVLMIGTNNAGDNTPTRSPRESPPSSSELRSRLPKTKVLLLGVFPRGEKPGPVRERLNR